MIIVYFLAGWFLLLILYIILSIVVKVRAKRDLITYDEWILKFDKKYSVKSDWSMETPLSGVKHNNRESIIIRKIKKGQLKIGDTLMLVPDIGNKYDNTAIRVCAKDGLMLGWLPNQEWYNQVYYDLVAGKKWEATVKKILYPSEEFNNYNLLIQLWEFNETINLKAGL